jgi:hypothetical protein
MRIPPWAIAAAIAVPLGIVAVEWLSGESDPCTDGRMYAYFGDPHEKGINAARAAMRANISSRRVSPGVWLCVTPPPFNHAVEVQVMSDGSVYYRDAP